MSEFKPDKVLVRAPNWVGDAVMALPALRQFRRIFADSEITLLARKWVAGLFDREGLADDVILLDQPKNGLLAAFTFVGDARRIRQRRFDLAVLLQNAFSAALLARAGGVAKIAGYPTDGRGALIDVKIPFQSNYKTEHQTRYYLNIARELELKLIGTSEIDLANSEPRFQVSSESKQEADRLVSKFAPQSSRAPMVALCPGATNSLAKRWPAHRFAETADRLAQKNGFQTVIVGSAGDFEAAEEVASTMKSPSTNLAGRTSISELKALLACSALVISNDTGTAHVSAALGIPTVVVFGPTEHVSTRPLSPIATVVRHDVECSPCMLRECPIDHRCMTGVEVDNVYRAAVDLLAAIR